MLWQDPVTKRSKEGFSHPVIWQPLDTFLSKTHAQMLTRLNQLTFILKYR
jgi:hypothetical protein